MNPPTRYFYRLAWAAALLAFGVVVFGAFVRLSNAGLSCPDWPTCYGRASWPVQAHDIAQANATFERAVEVTKTWREQFHRHLAATLGLLVLTLTLIAARKRRFGIASTLLASALVAASIYGYIQQQYPLAAGLAIAGELILLVNALRW